MFFQLDHPLRGVAWFEHAQDLVEQGRASELGEDQAFVYALFGRDPLKSFLPILVLLS